MEDIVSGILWTSKVAICDQQGDSVGKALVTKHHTQHTDDRE